MKLTELVRIRGGGPGAALSACGLACSLILLAAGCGGPKNVGRVSGKVTLDGQPLPNALVVFGPKNGQTPSAGTTDADGKYTLVRTRTVEGAELGEHTVRITTYRPGDPDADPPEPPAREKVPLRYNDQTELTAKVEAGDNPIDFDLDSKGEIRQPDARGSDDCQ